MSDKPPPHRRSSGLVDRERVVRHDSRYQEFAEIVSTMKQKAGTHPRVFHETHDPIPSFGIILYHHERPPRLLGGLLCPILEALVEKMHGSSIFYLVMQRRATIEYTTLVLGNWRFRDLHTLFSLLTPSERHRLVSHPFEELWADLMSGSDAKKREYSEKRFASLAPHLPDLLRLTSSRTRYPEIMFPKGRTNPGEDELSAAKREFREETNVPIDRCDVVDMAPVTETYRGSNGVLYSTKFFIMRSPTMPRRLRPTGHEASSVFWVSPRRGRDGIRSVENIELTSRRRSLLEQVHNSIVEYEGKNRLQSPLARGEW